MRALHNSFTRIIVSTLTCGLALACAESDLGDQGALRKNSGIEPKPPAGPTVFEIASPSSCANPCTFSVNTDQELARVVYSVDEYYIGESDQFADDYKISYEFSAFGERDLLAVGYNDAGTVVAKAVQTIEVEAPPAPEPPPLPDPADGVPYFYQYDNVYSPSATCQNTSIAMVLQYLGVSVTPDEITARYGKDRAQSPEGLAELFNIYADNAQTAKRIYMTRSGTLQGLREELDRGEPVIIHGFFTGYGHVLVVTGYDANGYYVNDPAGSWSEVFKGGYNGPRDSSVGHNIYYRRAPFEAAVATSDGYTPYALWYHALR